MRKLLIIALCAVMVTALGGLRARAASNVLGGVTCYLHRNSDNTKLSMTIELHDKYVVTQFNGQPRKIMDIVDQVGTVDFHQDFKITFKPDRAESGTLTHAETSLDLPSILKVTVDRCDYGY